MGMSVTIGTAAGYDSEQILKLQYLCYQAEAELYGDFRIAPLTQTSAGLLEEMAEGPVLVARLGEEVVGSARGRIEEDGAAAISRLMVHPRLRGHGLGRRLLTACEEALTRHPGVTCLRLRAGHRSEGHLRLYRQLGYAEVGTEEVTRRMRLITLEKSCAPALEPSDPAAGPVATVTAGV